MGVTIHRHRATFLLRQGCGEVDAHDRAAQARLRVKRQRWFTTSLSFLQTFLDALFTIGHVRDLGVQMRIALPEHRKGKGWRRHRVEGG